MSAERVPIAQPMPQFLGYCFKVFEACPAWVGAERVRRVASVTECNLPRPEGWVDRWDFNRAGLYETPAAARVALEESGDPDEFHLFAYEFYPLRFDHQGSIREVRVEEIFGTSDPLLPGARSADGLVFLGFDVVERWADSVENDASTHALAGGFGCSPLFCGMEARNYPANEYCLLDTWEDACVAAAAFAVSTTDKPGCYYVFGVFGEKL